MFTKGRGRSNERGFEITDTQRGITLRTKHFAEGKADTVKFFHYYPTWPFIIGGMIIWTVIANLFISRLFPDFSFWARVISATILNLLFLLLVALGYIIYLFSKLLSFALKNRDLLEWHGCEHKVITLLTEGTEPTIDNLRRAPRVHAGCGFKPLPDFIQKFFSTKEPNLEKLTEGLALARRYYEEVNKIGSSDNA